MPLLGEPLVELLARPCLPNEVVGKRTFIISCLHIVLDVHKYVCRVRDATRQADKMTRSHKRIADSLIGVATYVSLLTEGESEKTVP